MNTTNKPAAWFWIISLVALLWNIIGIMTFIMHVTMSEAALQAMPEHERALYTNFPMWVTVTYCIAVLTGIIGNVLLLLRKKLATPVLIISFIAIALQMSYTLFMSQSLAVHGAVALVIPVLVIGFAALLVWVSRAATIKGWLL